MPVTVGPSLSNRAKVEMEHVTFRTPGILAKAGVDVAIVTDHPCTIARNSAVLGSVISLQSSPIG